MSLRTITEADLQGKGNTGQPDVPNLDTAGMQHKLDELSLDVIVPIFNLLVGQLEAKEASADLGATVDNDYDLTLAQEELEKDAETKIQILINAILKECAALDISVSDLKTIFTGIESVENTVHDEESEIPTGKAIVAYVSHMGGGDMAKATYDRNDDGVADVKMEELTNFTGLASNGDVPTYESATQKWKPKTPAVMLAKAEVTSDTGSTVTMTDGVTTIELTEVSTGNYEGDIPSYGTWTVTSVLGGDTRTATLTVDTAKIYTVDLEHFSASITVTYPTGATVTCSDGQTTLTATGSPYTFTVHSSGTWTITGVEGGTTVTEDVVISTSGQTESVTFIHTISVDLYSAASDTVSFTDESGSKTATTDTTGKAEAVSITFSDLAPSITFTSSVAKDPDNLSNDYSKTVTIGNATTEIALMPEARAKMLYWWGYMGSDCEVISTANGWSYGQTLINPTFNTNNVSTSVNLNQISGIAKKTALTSASKAFAIGSGNGIVAGTKVKEFQPGGTNLVNGTTDFVGSSIAKYQNDVSSGSNFYPLAYSYGHSNNLSGNYYALWYE